MNVSSCVDLGEPPMLEKPHIDRTLARLRRARHSSAFRDGAGWQGFVLLALGWSGIGLAYGFAGIAGEPGSREAVLGAAAVSVASLAAVASGVVIAYTAARSALRRVFRSRVLFGTAATLLAVAAASVVAFVARAPLDGIGAHGKPLAELINELAFAAATLICGIGGVASLREAWKARRAERTWAGPPTISPEGRQR